MSPTRSRRRRLAGVLLALLLGCAGWFGTTATASAEEGFRYWNYSHLVDGSFEFAQTGPADHVPADGAVEGWRFGTSTVSAGIFPRADLSALTFDTVCAGTEAAAGEKRVAVLIDYGTEAEADGQEVPEPRAACAAVPADANGQQVLESVAELRVENAFVCALDGYPASGCGDPVKNAKVDTEEPPVAFALPTPAAGDDPSPAAEDAAAPAADDGSPWPLVAVLAVVALLAALAVGLARRRSGTGA